MELSDKNLKTLVIIAFVLSVFAILFGMASLWMAYDGSSVIDHKEFDNLHPGIKKLYRKIILGNDGIAQPYIEQVNKNYEKAIEETGGQNKFNETFATEVKKYMDSHPIFTSLK